MAVVAKGSAIVGSACLRSVQVTAKVGVCFTLSVRCTRLSFSSLSFCNCRYSEHVRNFIQKLTQDVRGLSAVRDLVSVTASGLLLGSGSAAQVRPCPIHIFKCIKLTDFVWQEFAFSRLPNLTYNIFAGTSLGIFRHVFQWWWFGKFSGYDYGAKKNVLVHGSRTPPVYTDHYDKIDIPVRTLRQRGGNQWCSHCR